MQISNTMPAVAGGEGGANAPRNLQEAAESFEALLVGELLKTVRESAEGSLTGEADGPSQTIREMADEHLAAALARSGGLGFARLILGQLAQAASQTAGASESNPKASL